MIGIKKMLFFDPWHIVAEDEEQKTEIINYLSAKSCERGKNFEIHKELGWLMVYPLRNAKQVMNYCIENGTDFQLTND